MDKRVEVGSLMEQHGAITSLEFFGQSHVLSGSADHSICIWRTSDWNCVHILGGHKYVLDDWQYCAVLCSAVQRKKRERALSTVVA